MFKNYRQDRCYIIAEIGGNFTTWEQAKRLVDAALECGVDAVKLQTYIADTISSKLAVFDMENTGVVSQHELFQKYEIDEPISDVDYLKNLDMQDFLNCDETRKILQEENYQYFEENIKPVLMRLFKRYAKNYNCDIFLYNDPDGEKNCDIFSEIVKGEKIF